MKKLFWIGFIIVFLFFIGLEEVNAAGSRIYGNTRYDTAVGISKSTWKSGADTVVLTRGNDFSDALASTPLAYLVNGPILLTNTNSLPAVTLKEMKRLKAKKVIIVGGPVAISAKIEEKLIAENFEVERIYGKDRLATSLEVAKRLNPSHSKTIIVNQKAFADAMVIAPYAARNKIPIVLVSDKNYKRRDVTEYMTGRSTMVVGGELVVSKRMFNSFPNATRIAGATRYQTSVDVANKYFGKSKDILVVTGHDFSDGLTGSIMAAKRNIPMLLVSKSKVDNSVKTYIKKKKIQNYTLLGGLKAIDGTVHKKLFAPVIDRKDPNLILVDKEHSLSKNFVPKNLVVPNLRFSTTISERKKMTKEAGTALVKLFKAAKKDGITLYAQSGYRSYATQKTLFNNYSRKYGEKEANRFSARAGQSEHQTGLAMDITSKSVNYQLVEKFGKTKEGKWLAKHADDYGFVFSYPKGKEKITGYVYEPWHVRYVGVDHALFMKKQGLTLSEYLAKY